MRHEKPRVTWRIWYFLPGVRGLYDLYISSHSGWIYEPSTVGEWRFPFFFPAPIGGSMMSWPLFPPDLLTNFRIRLNENTKTGHPGISDSFSVSLGIQSPESITNFPTFPCKKHFLLKRSCSHFPTVDGGNPAPPGMYKPCKYWDKLPINWCRVSAINNFQCLLFVFLASECFQQSLHWRNITSVNGITHQHGRGSVVDILADD